MTVLPSLSVLRSFEAAAKHQSFSTAAEELHISQGAVSRQVREFEAIIGTALFRKEGRGVALTPAGQALAEKLHANLDSLRQTLSHAQAAGFGAQTLAVAVLPTFASRWLAPRLPRFKALYPETQLIIRSRSVPFDLVLEGIDVAVHFGHPEWVGGTLTPLCPEDLVAVASPLLIEEHEIEGGRFSPDLPLLHLITRHTAWQDYFAGLKLDTRLALQGALFDQFATMISAATSGLGAAIVPRYLIETELAQGTLATLGYPEETHGMYYVAQPKEPTNPLGGAFANWICEEARKSSQLRNWR
ncbi:MAG: LysR substrate-binding domain-containing protein [Pseudomonadota bacterium]